MQVNIKRWKKVCKDAIVHKSRDDVPSKSHWIDSAGGLIPSLDCFSDTSWGAFEQALKFQGVIPIMIL